jgi:hypothetical protein
MTITEGHAVGFFTNTAPGAHRGGSVGKQPENCRICNLSFPDLLPMAVPGSHPSWFKGNGSENLQDLFEMSNLYKNAAVINLHEAPQCSLTHTISFCH